MSACDSRGRNRPRPAVRAVALAFAAAALLALPAGVGATGSATGCVVSTTRTHATYATVQAALDASRPGVTVLVRGTCVGATIVAKDAMIRAASDRARDRATLDSALGGSVLTINAGVTLRIERLIITGGYNQPAGGGILNNGTLVMKHSTVVDNTSQNGGGIANYGDATILDSKIDHNGVYLGGNILNAGTLVVKDSEITRGGGRFGQGLWNYLGAEATLIRSSVTDSDPALPFSGGGIENHGDLTLIESIVTRNSSLFGGGILNEGTARLIRSKVTGNTALSGGGIHNGPTFQPGSGSETLVLIGSKVNGNSAQYGGGIYNKGVVTLHSRTRIGGNTAAAVGQGGGIFNDPGARVTGIRHRTFTPANTPDDCVGCAP